MPRALMRVAVPMLLFAVTLCAQASTALRPTAFWIDVPYVHQPREGCGAASIAMIMQYWAPQPGGHPQPSGADVDAIQRQLYSPKEHGILASSMIEYLQQHGFTTIAFSGQWSDLEQQIGKGRPLIAALRPPGQSQLHYVVIDGVDTARGLVTINDPAERKLLTQERAAFEKDWSAMHNWVLLAVPATTGLR